MHEAIQDVQSQLHDLAERVATDNVRRQAAAAGGRRTASAAAVAAAADKRQATLFRIAGQMKLLVDTPERVPRPRSGTEGTAAIGALTVNTASPLAQQIWYALEHEQFLPATLLYLVARQIFNNLQAKDDSTQLGSDGHVLVRPRGWQRTPAHTGAL